MTQLYRTITSGSVTSVDFLNIPSGYDHLIIKIAAQRTTASASDRLHLRINNDSGSNYSVPWMVFTVNNTAQVSTSGFTNATTIAIPGPITSDGAGMAMYATVEIPLYSGTTFHKEVISKTGSIRHATDPTLQQFSMISNLWQNTAAVTRITIFVVGGVIVDGSAFGVYGI